MGTPHSLVNGQIAWKGKTKAAAEAMRDQHLDRLFADSDWEPIVIPFPQGIMVGFLNWAGNWESYTYWFHKTPAQRRCHGCEIHGERDKKQVLISLHRHVATLVRDAESSEAGLTYLWYEDHDGKEDYLQMDAGHATYKAARAAGKGDEAARDLADEARSEFANRPEREPVRSLEAALLFLEAGSPVPVKKHVWQQCFEAAKALTQEGQFLVFRGKQTFWCEDPHPPGSSAWITDTLIAGYADLGGQLYLLQLQPTDLVLPAPEPPLAASSLLT
jgi:hypothetical protein